jgi:hypothetical protein
MKEAQQQPCSFNSDVNDAAIENVMARVFRRRVARLG